MTGFSPDGPHDPDRTRQAAREISDLTRYLAYATRPGSGGIVNAADVYDLLGALSEAFSRIPQALAQCGTFLEAEAKAGRLGDTADREPALTAAVTAGYLGHAAHVAGQLAGKLGRAQSEMSGLYGADDA